MSGDGDVDNSAFTIEGDQLKIIDSPDFEGKSSYSIRLQTKDSAGYSLEKEVTLNVTDLNEVPSSFWVSKSTFGNNITGVSSIATHAPTIKMPKILIPTRSSQVSVMLIMILSRLREINSKSLIHQTSKKSHLIPFDYKQTILAD